MYRLTTFAMSPDVSRFIVSHYSCLRTAQRYRVQRQGAARSAATRSWTAFGYSRASIARPPDQVEQRLIWQGDLARRQPVLARPDGGRERVANDRDVPIGIDLSGR